MSELIWIVQMRARVGSQQNNNTAFVLESSGLFFSLPRRNFTTYMQFCIFHFEYIYEQVLQRRY